MGLLNWLEDSVVKATTNRETIRLSYDGLAKVVEQFFIQGADESYLLQVKRVSKGGLFFPKELKTADGRYTLQVGALQRGLWLLQSKSVWVLDSVENKFYQLDKDRTWRKFNKSVTAAIEQEIISRNK